MLVIDQELVEADRRLAWRNAANAIDTVHDLVDLRQDALLHRLTAPRGWNDDTAAKVYFFFASE
jgi:hypothetical protein